MSRKELILTLGNLPTNAFVAKSTTYKEPNAFAINPSNAAATVFEPSGANTAIVELSNPRQQALVEGAPTHRSGTANRGRAVHR